eukprot:757182-Hanusia_phi.AAC.3
MVGPDRGQVYLLLAATPSCRRSRLEGPEGRSACRERDHAPAAGLGLGGSRFTDSVSCQTSTCRGV